MKCLNPIHALQVVKWLKIGKLKANVSKDCRRYDSFGFSPKPNNTICIASSTDERKNIIDQKI